METDEEFYVKNPRRAPRFGRFMFFGGAIAAIIGLLIVQLGPEAGFYDIGDVAIAMTITAVPVGVLFGALLALFLDRQSVKKSESLD